MRAVICRDPNVESTLRAWAALAWAGATEEERALVRFGMTPVTLLKRDAPPEGCGPREWALALMDRANEVGKGMIV